MDFPEKTHHSGDIEKVVNSILFSYPGKSDASFASPILDSLDLTGFKNKIQYLRKKIYLITTKQSREKGQYGAVCVHEVDVCWKENYLNVSEKDYFGRFDLMRVKELPKAFLIHSKSTYVVDAKLAVYKHFQKDIESGNIFLHHEFDGYEKLAKFSTHHTISSFSKKVIAMTESIPVRDLPGILKQAADRSLSETNIKRLCHNVVLTDQGLTVGKVGSASYACRLMPTVNRLKERLMKETLDEAVASFASEITKGILVHIEAKIIEELKQDFKKINISISSEIFEEVNIIVVNIIVVFFNELKTLIISVVTFLVTLFVPVDINSVSWRNKVADEIYKITEKEKSGILDKTIQKIRPICERTVSELMGVHDKLVEGRRGLGMTQQERDVTEWKNREIIEDPSLLKMYPAILTFVAGRKSNYPCVKVFLKYDDKDAMNYFKERAKTPSGTQFEFVNVQEYSDVIKKESKNIKIEEKKVRRLYSYDRKGLYEELKKVEERIYAKHSNVIAIGTSSVRFNAKQRFYEPCFTLYCLDKDLVPFGEEPLPTQLGGYPCDIREDIVQFGYCNNCQALNPGCSIGIQWKDSSGSAGFLARSNSPSQTTGILTAAHVVVQEFEELIKKQVTLTNSGLRNLGQIVHPSWQDSADSSVIGDVVESYCGEYVSVSTDTFGIDAAFVRVFQPRTGEQVAMSVAKQQSNWYDGNTEVIKHGRTTSETRGILISNTFSCSIKSLAPNLQVFSNCYSIENNDEIQDEFFLDGDSGSGVYLEDGNSRFPLGIAFASLKGCGLTAVCRIDQVLRVLNVSVMQDVEMDIP